LTMNEHMYSGTGKAIAFAFGRCYTKSSKILCNRSPWPTTRSKAATNVHYNFRVLLNC